MTRSALDTAAKAAEAGKPEELNGLIWEAYERGTAEFPRPNDEMPDFTHSLDALLPLLQAKIDKGWVWEVRQSKYGSWAGMKPEAQEAFEIYHEAKLPSIALAVCLCLTEVEGG